MTKRTIFGMSATPLTDDNKIDVPALRLHLRRMVDAGIGVYLGAGGAGEGHTMSDEEMKVIFKVGVEECRGKVPTYATIPECRTAEQTFKRTQLAIDAGVEVVQVFFPDGGHGMRPRPQEQERFYRELLSTIDYPLALSFHIHSGFLPSIKLAETLCKEYKQVVAINAMVVPHAYLVGLMDTLGPKMPVYTAIPDLVTGLAIGSAGILSAEPNIVPNMCQRVLTAFEKGRMDEVGEAYKHLVRFGEIVNKWAPSTARWVKMAMRVLDLPGGRGPIREPYVMPTQEEQDEMARAFDKMGLKKLEGLK